MSSYFEEHKNDYYDRLQAVRETGDLEGWLCYFLAAIAEQANDAVARGAALTDLREEIRTSLRGSRSRAVEVVYLLRSSNPPVESPDDRIVGWRGASSKY